MAPSVCCPQPRWYSAKFSEVFEVFASVCKGLPSNLHVTELYATEPSMVELNGKDLKSFVGKDVIDQLLYHAEAGMVRAALDGDLRASEADNRLAVVEGRVDLVRRDLVRCHRRIDVSAARASEDGDALLNERLVSNFLFFFRCTHAL